VLINDVTAGADPKMMLTAARLRVPVCLMHAQGTPRTMQTDPQYRDLLGEVVGELAARMAALLTLSSTWDSYSLKFSSNILATFLAVVS